MKVHLTYFKCTGKYYTDGEYETNLESLHEIWNEVRQLNPAPGLASDGAEFFVLVNVPGHVHEHPKLLLPTDHSLIEILKEKKQ